MAQILMNIVHSPSKDRSFSNGFWRETGYSIGPSTGGHGIFTLLLLIIKRAFVSFICLSSPLVRKELYSCGHKRKARPCENQCLEAQAHTAEKTGKVFILLGFLFVCLLCFLFCF